MSTDAEVLVLINSAFMSIAKPEHFTDFMHCEECAEHDELLRTRNRDSLRIEDVGNICWQPISFCSAEGIAYYMPALARLALSEPTYDFGWYGDTLVIHLTSSGRQGEFFLYCNAEQRRAVAALLEHLNSSRDSLECRLTDDEEMRSAHALWSS